ncbi:hypothetical protein, partial [Saccharothrix longispora]|uniref:hypothetical protein n=1 Tax=Saccharothrix longispora TaxID=33920 RepID=UPI0028FDA835
PAPPRAASGPAPATHLLVRARTRREAGPGWRTVAVGADDLRGLPVALTAVVRQMVADLDRVRGSRAAGAGWLAPDKLYDAHVATWRSVLLLVDTVDTYRLIRESSQFAELEPLTRDKVVQVGAVEAVVRDVAARLGEAAAKVAEIDAGILDAEERDRRERRIAELTERLTDTSITPASTTAPPVWQDAVDAVNAHLDGALTVLGHR